MTPPPRTLGKPLPGPSQINTNNNDIAANTLQQPKQTTMPANPWLQPTCKAPLLPTPPAPARQHRNSTFPRPSPSSYNRNSTFPRPSQFQSNRFHQQHLPRAFYHQQPPLLPLPLHQIPAPPRPYPPTHRHIILQVLTYLPVLLPYLSHHITSLQYIQAT